MWKLQHLFVCVLVGAALEVVQGQQARAVFNAKGIKGYISFMTINNGSVRIQTNVEVLTGNQRWHVHLFPVDQTVDPNVQCTGNYVGPHYDPFNQNNGTGNYTARCREDRVMCEAGDLSGKWGYLMPNTNKDVVDDTGTLFLRGRYSIVGRSIVIHSPTSPYPNFACATIRSLAEIQGNTAVTVLQATFVKPIAGVMYFKQVQGEEVQMWGKMFWVNGMGDTADHNWHIHRFVPGEEFRMGTCNTSGNIGGHYAPFGNGPTSASNYSQVCGPDMLEGCEVGDLTGKHTTINVYGSPAPYSTGAFFFTDSFLNLTGVNAVVGRSIAIHQANRGGPVMACAPLIESETLTLTQYSEKEVTISQTSPYEYTVITNSLVRDMTVIQNSPFAPLALNCYASSDLIFSDYGTTGPADSNTPDRFSTGALSSRYRESSGIPSPLQVFDLPVYGANSSISSLNLRAARNNQNNCSALITSLMDSNVILARATFSGSLGGAVYFIQRNYGDGQAGSDMLGNTFIIVDMYRTAVQDVTTGHSWRVFAGATPSSGCPSSLTAYNPYQINTVRTVCNRKGPLSCASGDLSGKHGTIGIGSDTTSRPTYTFTDNNVLLTGSFRVIGNSVAILSGSTGLDCGTITRAYVSKTSFTFIAPRDSSQTRTSATQTLAKEIQVDPSDILVFNMRTAKVYGFNCIAVTVKVLGSSQSAADNSVQTLKDNEKSIISQIKCGGAMRSAAVSVLAMAVPLLLALFHLVFKGY